MSGSAKESKNPESNNDSSSTGIESFLETFFRMAMIRALLSIGSIGADREKPGVLGHQLLHQHVGDQAIAGACEVYVVSLAQAGLHPLANGTGAAHSHAPVPECAAGFSSDLTLDLDHVIQMRERQPAATRPELAIGRAHYQDAGHRRVGANAADHFGER